MNANDQKTISSNRVDLVEQMELSVVLDGLLERRTITQAQYEELMPANAGERRKKVREFLGVIVRRGSTAFNDLCEVLIETKQEHLAELLCPGKALKTLEKGSTKSLQPSIPEIQLSSEQFICTPLTELTPEKIQEYLRRPNNNAYKMTAPRGRALIINNEAYSNASMSLSDRSGSTEDSMNLNTLFTELNFETSSELNNTAQEMRDVIKKETQNESHQKYGMFVLVILSHGENDAVYGVDGTLLPILDIKQLLCSQNFSSMAGKPKFILLQAYQSGKPDGNIKKDDAEADAAPAGNAGPRDEFADMLVAYPTCQGKVPDPQTEIGSLFTRAIVEVFRRNSHKDHILEMLVAVRRIVQKMSVENGCPQGTSDENHLKKLVYLLPGWSE